MLLVFEEKIVELWRISNILQAMEVPFQLLVIFRFHVDFPGCSQLRLVVSTPVLIKEN